MKWVSKSVLHELATCESSEDLVASAEHLQNVGLPLLVDEVEHLYGTLKQHANNSNNNDCVCHDEVFYMVLCFW